jgi:ketosteroid isomerase-like protein
MEFFADDGAIIREGKTLTGKDGIRQLYQPLFANREFTLSWVPTRAEASQDGTLGYTYGDYEAKIGAETSRGMYVTVWRKINGHWKVILDVGSQPRQQPKEAAQNP